ncbi:MAG: hypothetical protein WDW36_010152 [Sanguina aurantia]
MSRAAAAIAIEGSDELVNELSDALGPNKKRAPFDNLYVLGLLWQQRQHLSLALLMLVLCTASNLAAPVLSGLLTEALINNQPLEKYAQIFGILAVSYTLEPFFTKVYMENMISAGEKVLATLRLELFRTLLMQRITYFDTHSASELTNLISVELDTVRQFVFNNVSRDRGLRSFLEAAGSVLVLFFLSWRLAPVCSIVIVATAVAAALFRKFTRDIEQRQGQSLQRMSAVAYQALDNMKVVRSFAGEALERERFQTHVLSSFRAGLAFASAKSWFEASNRAAIHASLLCLYAWGGWLVSNSLMPLRVLISGIGFTFSLMYATQGSVSTLAEMRRATGAFKRIREMMQSAEPDPSMYGALPPGAWWEVANGKMPPENQPYAELAGERAVEAARAGDLMLRDVHFSYPSRSNVAVLNSLTLNLVKGTTTALVGRSGAGKSTIANLLSRFYEPQQGDIILNGIPITDFSRGEWSKAVALVSQEPVLFSGTIADNISYGRYGNATKEEIEAASRAANAHEFIDYLPQGYQTVVGERGVLLSGGQRQRIAIARALLKDSPILILDEATSALDLVSEKLVQQAVSRLVKGRTVLIIAHRLSTVQAADQIVVMKNGGIIEVGTHDELVEARGHYSDLMQAQNLSLASK